MSSYKNTFKTKYIKPPVTSAKIGLKLQSIRNSCVISLTSQIQLNNLSSLHMKATRLPASAFHHCLHSMTALYLYILKRENPIYFWKCYTAMPHRVGPKWLRYFRLLKGILALCLNAIVTVPVALLRTELS